MGNGWGRALISVLLLGLMLAGCATQPQMQSASAPGETAISSFPGMRLLPNGNGWFFQGGAYRTTDGGQHWQDVTPGDLQDSHFFTGYALDARHAWLAASIAGQGMRLYRTTDGGQHWQSIPLIDKTGPAIIQFSDPDHGNLLLGLAAGMSHEAVALFTTQNGGKHWTEVAGTRPGYFSGPLMIGPLNDLCCIGAVTFRNARQGWITGTYSVINKIYFQYTDNGGRRWIDQALPLKPTEDQAFASVAPPVFMGEQGWLAISLTWNAPGKKEKTRMVLFHTGDGGKSWQRQSQMDHTDSGAYRRPLVSFVSPELGWMRWGSVLYRTKDGGKHWQAVDLNLVDAWTSLQFVNATTGWVESLHSIMVTHDGGASWQQLKTP